MLLVDDIIVEGGVMKNVSVFYIPHCFSEDVVYVVPAVWIRPKGKNVSHGSNIIVSVAGNTRNMSG
jgi:hypothetical protein